MLCRPSHIHVNECRATYYCNCIYCKWNKGCRLREGTKSVHQQRQSLRSETTRWLVSYYVILCGAQFWFVGKAVDCTTKLQINKNRVWLIWNTFLLPYQTADSTAETIGRCTCCSTNTLTVDEKMVTPKNQSFNL